MPPLDGIRVVDLTRVLAGPFCTMILGDMGAEVIKVEEPFNGDDSRAWAPFIEGWSSYFLGVNRNKKSVALDLKTPQGADVLRRLVTQCDVFIENFRPGTLTKLGFDFPSVQRLNPRAIYCSIAGYGQTGPRSRLAGYDPVVQAEAGLMEVNGFPGHPAARVGVAMTDYIAGLFAVSGILLALRERDKTGQGQHLDIALFDSLMSTMTLPVGIYFATGESPSRMGNQHPSIAPYETLRASDGWLMVCAGNPRLWVQFCEAIGHKELTEDSRFVSNDDRLRNRAELVDAIERIFSEFTVGEIVARLEARSIPCGRVRSVAEAIADPQLSLREMLVEMEHQDLGSVRMIGSPLKLSRTPGTYRIAPPRLGEHTEDVLRSLGYSDAEIQQIRAAAGSAPVAPEAGSAAGA